MSDIDLKEGNEIRVMHYMPLPFQCGGNVADFLIIMGQSQDKEKCLLFGR